MANSQIVAAIIEKDGCFLLGKRSQSKRNAPGCWAPISGQIEDGESEKEAIVREVCEEVGLVVLPIKKIAVFEENGPYQKMYWWKVKLISGIASLINDEHSELRWVTIEEMKNLEPMLPRNLGVFLSLSAAK